MRHLIKLALVLLAAVAAQEPVPGCVNGCNRRPVARGMCRRCYVAWHRAGGREQIRQNGTAQQRTMADFWASIQKDAGGCWIWQGPKNDRGYGRMVVNGVLLFAHRASYEHHKGPIPSEAFILHSCHNPSCVNPDHLRVGTHQENMTDKAVSGRAARLKGEDNPYSKLTSEQAEAIRTRRSDGESATILAREYGIDRTHVYRIAKGKAWK